MPTVIDTDDVRRMLAEGAQLVDVLPAETFAREHIAGAINIPIADIASARDQLDADRPVIVYCYDHECDLSARAARRLELLGCRDVYDYAASKTAWLGAGLPGAGLRGDGDRAGAAAHRDVPAVGPDATLADAAAVVGAWEVVVVTDDAGVVLGAVRREALDGGNLDHSVAAVMHTAVPTVRPSISARQLARSMDDDGEERVLATTYDGRLIGLVRRRDLDVY
jgi:rhodanese-related sulfurtransferase